MTRPICILLLIYTSLILISSCTADSRAAEKDQNSGPLSQPGESVQERSGEQVVSGLKSETRNIHPSFELDYRELVKLTEGCPLPVRERILRRPEYFLQLLQEALELPEWALVLVDKEHSLPEGYAPEDLIGLKNYSLSLNRDTLQLSRSCMPDLLAMTEAARMEGIELVYSSTYRDYAYQKMLYEKYISSYGQEEADRFSARPGTSQHQLGTAIDFGSITPEFGNTDQGRWLFEHAWEYGFSLSYPEGMEEITGYMFEIWHYRYITRTGTRLEREFFEGIQQYLTEFLHENTPYLREHLIRKDTEKIDEER